MRHACGFAIAIATLLAGCHPPTAGSAGHKDAVSLFTDLQAKFEAIPSDTGKSFDLRTPEGIANLKTALQPSTAALDEAGQALNFESYSDVVMPAADFAKDANGNSPKSSIDMKLAVFLKRLVKALGARARLEYADGKYAQGLTDLKVAARTIHLFGSRSGSYVPTLTIDACTSIVTSDIQQLSLDTTLDGKQWSALTPVCASMEVQVSFLNITKAEQAASRLEKKSTPAEDKEAKQGYPKLLSALASEPHDPATPLAALRAQAPKHAFTADPTEISKLGLLRIVYMAFVESRHQLAGARLTAAFAQALSQQDRSGKFPATLPATGTGARDPFGDGRLAYVGQKDGFTISAPASKGYVTNPVLGETYHVTYPIEKYRPVGL